MTTETKEYIVTLKNKEDLQEFYDDMETPGGNLYIPDRQVEVTARRNISRNTHYRLTNEEAQTIKNDPRVATVISVENVRNRRPSLRQPNYEIVNGVFNKQSTDNNTHKNWALLRCLETTNRASWGSDATGSITESVKINASGRNVDVVIIDGHIDPNHPEFAVNPDGTGGSRVIQYNWLQNMEAIGAGTNGTYVYTPYVDAGNAERTADNNHGCHVAGIAVGNTQGWARNANIYNISPYETSPNPDGYLYFFDLVRYWHNNKPVNPTTGRKNPTIVNCSFGWAFTYNFGIWGPITRVNYRGTDFNPGRALTLTELRDRGIYTNTTSPVIPFNYDGDEVDTQEMIDDGIIVVGAAGNEYFKVSKSGDQDYNNVFYATEDSVNTMWYLHRGTPPANIGICVGAVDSVDDERKGDYSNCGPRVDVFAPGTNINSSTHNDGSVSDPRNSSYKVTKYEGTSMASPQVCGVLACLLELYPNMTQALALDYLTTNTITNQMYNTNTDNPMDVASLQSADNKYLYFKKERVDVGVTLPKQNVWLKPATGVVYPRPRIRMKG